LPTGNALQKSASFDALFFRFPVKIRVIPNNVLLTSSYMLDE